MGQMGLLILGQGAVKLPVLDEGGFFSIGKIVCMLICMFIWAWPTGWACRDARRLGLIEFKWGTLIAATSVAGWFCWIMVPQFWIGLPLFVLLCFGGVLTYAIYRDTIVDEQSKILRPTNIIRAIRGEKPIEFSVEQKVRLSTTVGTPIDIPEDEDKQQSYQLFQNLIFDGLWRRASDIYIKPKGEESRISFRIDGVLNEYMTCDRKLGQALIDYCKGIAELNVKEHRQPQQGKLIAKQLEVDLKVELDIESSGSRAGERLTVKIRAEETKFTIADIGFTDEQIELLQPAIEAKAGLIVFTGMPGCGLSTTLYAWGRSHDAFTQNIYTLEAKPLMDLDNVTQNIYKVGSDQTFPRTLQSISRREPDIILVDPSNDAETVEMIGQIVSTKHKKICTTTRASSSLSALNRIVRWLGDPKLASEVLIAVVFQRLARVLCPACREAYRPNPQTLRKLNLSAKSEVTFYRPSAPIVDKKGNPILCPNCQGTGYLGRTAITELIIVDKRLREAIRSGDATKLKAAARKSGLKYWHEVAMDKVIAGVTSVQEIIRVNKESQVRVKKR